MSPDAKIIVAVISSIFGGGILFGLLRYFIMTYFKRIDSSINELFSSRNEHGLKLESHERQIENNEKQIFEMKDNCKENHKKTPST